MARYDVYRAARRGYLLDVQSDVLLGLNTRVVVPLLPRHKAPQPARWLNPVFEIEGEPTIMATQFLAAIPAAELQESVCSLKEHQAEISAALDMLFLGF